MSLQNLSRQLTESARKPSRRTLTLIDRALALLIPYESKKNLNTSPSIPSSPKDLETLLSLLTTHRTLFLPYLDTDKVESNLHLQLSATTMERKFPTS